jgi:hypothetical protein
MEVWRPSLQRVQGRALAFPRRVNLNGGWYQRRPCDRMYCPLHGSACAVVWATKFAVAK